MNSPQSNQMMQYVDVPVTDSHPLKNKNRKKRQLLIPRRHPLRTGLYSRIPVLPPREPIILPLVTSALSERIRSYPYYLQEIPLAMGETIMDSIREVAPHFTQTLKEISPGIIELVNMIPECKEFTFSPESHEENSNDPSRYHPGSSGQIELLRRTDNNTRNRNTRDREGTAHNITIYTESNKRNPNDPSGDHPSSRTPIKRLRRIQDTSKPTDIRTKENAINNEIYETEPVTNTRREFQQHQIQDKGQIGRNKTECTEYFPQFKEQRTRRLLEDYKNIIHSELNQSQEASGESIYNVEQHSTSDQRITDENVPIATENKKAFHPNKKIIGGMSAYIFPTDKINKNAHVIITDGYSVMRNSNGENKISETTIQ
ncbi:hypothetical protein EVAR_28005_1 [Eumeta japonica]|uniref:Uncharacterized protein n=1 Tax=Eumeta variegata TaxID=151549 RepID=A0A4C1WDV4_EUMVA|nr:hypothetical protein EVAR_28005_1 [Eumeta japonica]